VSATREHDARTGFITCSRVAANRAAPPGAEPHCRGKRPWGEHPGVPAARTLRGGVAGWGCSRSGPVNEVMKPLLVGGVSIVEPGLG
jgi:hypothetical protein